MTRSGLLIAIPKSSAVARFARFGRRAGFFSEAARCFGTSRTTSFADLSSRSAMKLG
jgi:hypothetical protein